MFEAIGGWRFIFSILIVWHHMPIWKPENADIGNPVVTFFFILSGFLIALSHKDRFLTGELDAKHFIIKRCATIFPLQWLFTIVFVIFSINVVSYWAIPFHLTLTQSLNPLWEINFTLNTPSWFLSSIFVCYLLTPYILMHLKERRKFVALFVVCVLSWQVFLCCLPDEIGRKWLCYINPFVRLINYCTGVLLALYWQNIKKLISGIRLKTIILTLIEVFVVVLIGFVICNVGASGWDKYVRFPALFLSFSICLFIIVFCIGKGAISKVLSLPVFKKLGALSIVIYMSHGFVIHFTRPLLDISLPLYILVSLTLILVLSFILEKYYCNPIKQYIVKYLKGR